MDRGGRGPLSETCRSTGAGADASPATCGSTNSLQRITTRVASRRTSFRLRLLRMPPLHRSPSKEQPTPKWQFFHGRDLMCAAARILVFNVKKHSFEAWRSRRFPPAGISRFGTAPHRELLTQSSFLKNIPRIITESPEPRRPSRGLATGRRIFREADRGQGQAPSPRVREGHAGAPCVGYTVRFPTNGSAPGIQEPFFVGWPARVRGRKGSDR
jgi:hypothetical protein